MKKIRADLLRRMILDAGAYSCGFVPADAVDAADMDLFMRWRDSGAHAGMSYLERNDGVRTDPRLLLEGARTLIVCLFNYHTEEHSPGCLTDRKSRLDFPEADSRAGTAVPDRGNSVPYIAEYARGRDYHLELRDRLLPVSRFLTGQYGGEARICIDSAPLRERYWAVRAGLGFCGRNCQLIVPGAGSAFFIATVLWTGEVDGYSVPLEYATCGTCRACVDACPTGALRGDGTLDARRCLSYLTIESRLPVPDDIPLAGNLYGCDACRLACPHGRKAPVTDIEAFRPRTDICSMTTADWCDIGTGAFRRLTTESAMTRARVGNIRANARCLLEDM